jgi:hypothetical protein
MDPCLGPFTQTGDFYLWGHMKQLVYSTPIDTVDQLWQRLEDAREIIRQNRQTLENLQESLLRRATLCIQNGGGH